VSETFDRLCRAYAVALREALSKPGEGSLARAHALGREALDGGLGILDVATIHDAARTGAREAQPECAGDPATRAAEQAFFVEALSPFEMVHRSTGETNATLRRINDILEREVRRMAHALHDDIGPLLFLAHMSLHELAEDAPPPVRERVEAVRGRLDQVEAELRRLSHELRPRVLEDLGLAAALRHLAEVVAMRAGIPVRVRCPEGAVLSDTVQTGLYRIIQQALINVSKHAHASQATVAVMLERRGIRCTIDDDGVGFPSSKPAGGVDGASGLGLVGMRERAEALGGTFSVSSAPGRGTRIQVTIPSEV
jgi:signal transduction histidine kinase